MFPRIGNLEASFLALMGVVGVGTAAIVTREPSWNDAALMPLLWPIAVALLFDIVTAGLRGGGLPPLPHADPRRGRAAGDDAVRCC